MEAKILEAQKLNDADYEKLRSAHVLPNPSLEHHLTANASSESVSSLGSHEIRPISPSPSPSLHGSERLRAALDIEPRKASANSGGGGVRRPREELQVISDSSYASMQALGKFLKEKMEEDKVKEREAQLLEGPSFAQQTLKSSPSEFAGNPERRVEQVKALMEAHLRTQEDLPFQEPRRRFVSYIPGTCAALTCVQYSFLASVSITSPIARLRKLLQRAPHTERGSTTMVVGLARISSPTPASNVLGKESYHL